MSDANTCSTIISAARWHSASRRGSSNGSSNLRLEKSSSVSALKRAYQSSLAYFSTLTLPRSCKLACRGLVCRESVCRRERIFHAWDGFENIEFLGRFHRFCRSARQALPRPRHRSAKYVIIVIAKASPISSTHASVYSAK